MIYNYQASYDLGNQKYTQNMTYSSDDVVATLRRRIKTAFPAATNIDIISLDEFEQPVGAKPKGVK